MYRERHNLHRKVSIANTCSLNSMEQSFCEINSLKSGKAGVRDELLPTERIVHTSLQLHYSYSVCIYILFVSTCS